jgi:hypothetical protein
MYSFPLFPSWKTGGLLLACSLLVPHSVPGQFLVSNPVANIIYRGVETHLTMVSGEAVDTLLMEGARCISWERLAPNHIEWVVLGEDSARDVVIRPVINGRASPDAYSFRLKRPPAPELVFGGHVDGQEISRSNMLSVPGLSAGMNGFDYPVQVQIISYTAVIPSPDYPDVGQFEGVGPGLSPALRARLQELPLGSVLAFDQVQVRIGSYLYPELLSLRLEVTE